MYSFPDLDSLPPLKNTLLLNQARIGASALEVPRPPAWVMRQAGRYLPEFQAVRAKHSFFEVCETPELACEVTLQPIDRFAGLLDASIIFSDILVVAKALGLAVEMKGGVGPHFPEPLRDGEDARRRVLSRETDVSKELGYVYDAVTLTRTKLDGRVPLIGFSAAPWTLFCYMAEGGGSKTWEKAKSWCYRDPESAHAILERIATVSAEYLAGQVRSGAQLLQVFDTNADLLSPPLFEEFVLAYIRMLPGKVAAHLDSTGTPHVPMTIFAKGANTRSQMRALAESGYQTVGLDWGITARQARAYLREEPACPVVALQGNLDPAILVSGREAIEREVRNLVNGPDGFLTVAREGIEGGWIFNLGHGITPGVNPEDLRFCLERLHAEAAESTKKAAAKSQS